MRIQVPNVRHVLVSTPAACFAVTSTRLTSVAPNTDAFDNLEDVPLNQLTSANYGDDLANASPWWDYDAAGIRAIDLTRSGTWSYDNLNHLITSPQGTYEYDTLGNRRIGAPKVADLLTSKIQP